MNKSILVAALAAIAVVTLAATSHAQLGQTALSKCVDSVVAACNKKKSDASVNACVNSGVSQCEKQHKAQIQLPTAPRGQTTGLATPGR